MVGLPKVVHILWDLNIGVLSVNKVHLCADNNATFRQQLLILANKYLSVTSRCIPLTID